ncbi:MAG: serine hydrolase domain-containing protein [Myxococcota bacterium]
MARGARVRVPADKARITTDATPEDVDLRALGVRPGGVEAIWSEVERFFDTGLHPAIALCIRRRGHVILDRAVGWARGADPDDPPGARRELATPDTPFCIFSASKAVTGMVVHHLDDRGLLHIDDRVVEYIPEFGRHGKAGTTIRHVLTHRAGIPSVPTAGDPIDMLTDWDAVLDALCAAEPTWRPGRRLAYHAITGGFVLGEIVRRVTGRTIREVLQEDVLDPLGFRWMNYGVAEEDMGRVARSAFTGRGAPFPLSWLVKRALGVSFREAAAIANDPRWLRPIIPAGNIVATANEASRFYQLLLDEGVLDGVRVFDSRTVHRAAIEDAYLEVDFTLAVPVRYGLGFMLGTDRVSPFGPGTARAFGHLGFSEVLTWADPRRQLSVGLLTSGKPFFGPHLRRLYGVLSAISTQCPPV